MLGSFLLSALSSHEEFLWIRLSRKLNEKLIRSAFAHPYESYEKYKFREQYHVAQKCIGDSKIKSLTNAFFSFIAGILTLIPLIWIVSMLNWWLWLLLLGSVVVNCLCEIVRGRYARSILSESTQNDFHMLYARDVLTGYGFAKEVRLFHMFRYVTETMKRYIRDLANIQKAQAYKIFRIYLLCYTYHLIFTVAVFIYTLFQCISGFIPIPEFMVVSLAIIGLSEQSVVLAKSGVTIKEALYFVSKYRDTVSTIPQKSDTSTQPLKCGKNSSIQFQNVSFKYEKCEKPALQDISLTLPCGRFYGIVGKNGSGKTTFANLLMKFYSPGSGSISFDGHDLSEIDTEAWQANISAVLQDYHVYSFTVGENISFGRTDIPDPRTSMLAIPYGADVAIGSEFEEGGIELSGGEEQKLVMMRALYKDADIFILDEPTSSLSPKNEKLLYETVKTELVGKTVFFISHRLASCTICDEILVFDDGCVVERGRHAELMDKSSYIIRCSALRQACLMRTMPHNDLRKDVFT